MSKANDTGKNNCVWQATLVSFVKKYECNKIVTNSYEAFRTMGLVKTFMPYKVLSTP